MARLFVAIWPTADVVERLRAVPRDSWREVRWIPERNWHITLRFLGESPIEPVIEALGGVELPAVTAVVTPRIVRLGGRSLVVPVDGVEPLANAVGAGEPRFRGHLTLGRSRGRRPILGQSDDRAPEEPIAFDVRDVALVASVLSEHGSVYDTVARFTTTPGDGAR